jgi:hypothetical protein
MKQKTHYSSVVTIAEGVTLGVYHAYEDDYKYNLRPCYRLDIANADGTVSIKHLDADSIEDLYFILTDIRNVMKSVPLPDII